MIDLPGHAPVLLFSEPADMRKGHPGLYGLVKAAGEDPYSGELFVFISRRRDRAKILTFDKGGFVVWYKRLERGRFRHPRRGDADVVLDGTVGKLRPDDLLSRYNSPGVVDDPRIEAVWDRVLEAGATDAQAKELTSLGKIVDFVADRGKGTRP